MSVSHDLARFALGADFGSLSPEVVHEAKRATLDALGCAIGAFSGPPARALHRVIEETGGTPESTVIGSGLRTSCLNSVLINGTMVRYLEYNDSYAVTLGKTVGGSHPSEIIPTVLAVGEREHISGKEAIAATVLGYELIARMVDAAIPKTWASRGWGGATEAPFVVPLVAGKVLRLNEEQMVHALGISGSHNFSLSVLDTPGEAMNMTKNLRFPRPAQSGVLAALLAQRGFTGPIRVIEGHGGFSEVVMGGSFNVAKLTESGPPKIMETIYKYMCSDQTMQGHLNATQNLVKQHNLRPEDVVKVRVWAGTRAIGHTCDPVKRHTWNKETADHSSYYCTARIIMDHALGPAQFAEEKLQDPRARELIERIDFEADPDLDQFISAGISEITTRQGATYRNRVEYCKGHPKNPMSDAELEEKFLAMALEHMDKGQAQRVIDTAYRMDQLDDIGALMRTVVFKK